jgi:hypothetical protein
MLGQNREAEIGEFVGQAGMAIRAGVKAFGQVHGLGG